MRRVLLRRRSFTILLNAKLHYKGSPDKAAKNALTVTRKCYTRRLSKFQRLLDVADPLRGDVGPERRELEDARPALGVEEVHREERERGRNPALPTASTALSTARGYDRRKSFGASPSFKSIQNLSNTRSIAAPSWSDRAVAFTLPELDSHPRTMPPGSLKRTSLRSCRPSGSIGRV